MSTAFQDLLGARNHCHGCGAFNPQGLQIKSYWDGNGAICRFTPQAHHCAGSTQVVNGGIIASLIDCHSVNLAMALAYKEQGREIGTSPEIWCVTGSLKVDYLKPTPIGTELVITARADKKEGRKTWLTCEVTSNNILTAKGEVLAIELRDTFAR